MRTVLIVKSGSSLQYINGVYREIEGALKRVEEIKEEFAPKWKFKKRRQRYHWDGVNQVSTYVKTGIIIKKYDVQ